MYREGKYDEALGFYTNAFLRPNLNPRRVIILLVSSNFVIFESVLVHSGGVHGDTIMLISGQHSLISEHLLFKGSKVFQETKYEDYLGQHGGSNNAVTHLEHTVYNFVVDNEGLEGALKRFADAFALPNFDHMAIEYEIQLINLEFNLRSQNDYLRLEQIYCCSTSPDHVFNRFTWGNEKSLSNERRKNATSHRNVRTAKRKRALSNGEELKQLLEKFHKKFYRGSSMKLVVSVGVSINTVVKWVQSLFKAIKRGNSSEEEIGIQLPIWDYKKRYRVHAVSEVQKLNLAWTLPSQKMYSKAEEYLGFVLGSEGDGSLISMLREKGWVISGSAGVGASTGGSDICRTSFANIFSMSLLLTTSGLTKIDDITLLVYRYLQSMRVMEPAQDLFEKLKNVATAKFEYLEDQTAEELSENLLRYRPEHAIKGKYMFEWDPNYINKILGFFVPKYMRVDLLLSELSDEKKLVEPWFESQYVQEDIPHKFLKSLENPTALDVHLPHNTFVPSNFPKHSEADYFYIENNNCTVKYEPDRKNSTLASVVFNITLDIDNSTAMDVVMIEFFNNFLNDQLRGIIHEANAVGFNISICLSDEQFEMNVCGFGEIIPRFLSEVSTKISSLSTIKEVDFQVVKEKMGRMLNQSNTVPKEHCQYLLKQLLRKEFWSMKDKSNALKDLTIEKLQDFVQRLLPQLYFTVNCQGNFLKEEDITIGSELEISTRRRDKFYYFIEPTEGFSIVRLRALTDCFYSLVNGAFMSELKNKLRVAYDVECILCDDHIVRQIIFSVESSKATVYISTQIDEYIKRLETSMKEEWQDFYFNDAVREVRSQLLEEDSERENYIKELDMIDRDSLCKWYSCYMKVGTEMCKRLRIRVWGRCDRAKGSSSLSKAEDPYLSVKDEKIKKSEVIQKALTTTRRTAMPLTRFKEAAEYLSVEELKSYGLFG